MYSDAVFKHRRQSNIKRDRESRWTLKRERGGRERKGGIEIVRMKKRVSEIERD